MGVWEVFGPASAWPDQDFVALSEYFDADIALAGYRSGVFPMPIDAGFPEGSMAWWSPVERGILPLEALRVPRSLAKSVRKYRVTVDAAFDEVLARCGDPRRPDGWIDDDIRAVYSELYAQGHVHSVEVWTPTGQLAGGLYGVSIGGLFAGESMFHDPEIGRDASKVALVHLVRLLAKASNPASPILLDVQWLTPHLQSLGAIAVERDDYLALLDEALDQSPPDWSVFRA